MKKKWISQIQDNIVLYAVILIAVAGIGVYFLFFRSSGVKEQTLVVHPADFLQQVSVSGRIVSVKGH